MEENSREPIEKDGKDQAQGQSGISLHLLLYSDSLSSRLNALQRLQQDRGDELGQTNDPSGKEKPLSVTTNRRLRLIRLLLQSLIKRSYRESLWIVEQQNALIAAPKTEREMIRTSSTVEMIIDVFSDIKAKIDDDFLRVNALNVLAYVLTVAIPSGKGLTMSNEMTIRVNSIMKLFNDVFDTISSVKAFEKADKVLHKISDRRDVYCMMMQYYASLGENISSVMLCQELDTILSIDPALYQQIKLLIMQSYIKLLLQSKQSPQLLLDRFQSLLRGLKIEDWHDKVISNGADSLESLILKQLKKSPEGSSTIAATLLSSITVDTSSFVSQGGNASCLRLLKSSEAIVRSNGLTMTKNLFSKCHDEEATSLLLQTLLDGLQGKGGALTSLEHRSAVLSAILSFLETNYDPARDHLIRLQSKKSLELFPILISLAEKEVDENQRNLLAFCVGATARHFETNSDNLVGKEPFPDSYLELLQSGISGTGSTKNKSSSILFSLQIVSQMLRNAQIGQKLSPLAPIILNIIKEASKKPQACQPDGILALDILCSINNCLSSSHSVEATKIIGNCLVSPSFVTASSFQYMLSSLYSSYQSNSLTIHPGIAIQFDLLMTSVIRIITTTTTTIPSNQTKSMLPIISGVFVDMLLHDNRSIREFSYKSLPSMIESHPVLVIHLLQMILQRCNEYEIKLHQFHVNRVKNYKNSQLDDGNTSIDPSTSISMPKHASSSILSQSISEIHQIFTNFITKTGLNGLKSFFSDSNESKTISSHLSLLLQLTSHSLVYPSNQSAINHWKYQYYSQLQQIYGFSHGNDAIVSNEVICESIRSILEENIHIAPSYQTKGLVRWILILSSMNSCEICKISSNFSLEWIWRELFDKTMTIVIKSIGNRQIFELSSEDILLLTQFEQVVQQTIHSNQENPSNESIRLTNADRKKEVSRSNRKGNAFGKDDDEEWLERMKREKELKLLEQSKSLDSSFQERIRSELLTKLQTIETTILSTRRCLEVIDAMIAHSHDDLLQSVLIGRYSIHLLLFPLMTHEIFSQEANQLFCKCVMRGLKGCVPETVARNALDSLRLIVSRIGIFQNDSSSMILDNYQKKELLSYLSPIQSLFKSLSTMIQRYRSQHPDSVSLTINQSTQQGLFHPIVLILLFPLFEGVLYQSLMNYQLPGCEIAFGLFDMMIDVDGLQFIQDSSPLSDGSKTPMPSTRSLVGIRLLLLLLYLLSHSQIDPSPESVLKRFFLVCRLNSDEWEILLNEKGLLSSHSMTRLACLRAMTAIDIHAMDLESNDWLSSLKSRIFLLQYDEDEAITPIARSMYQSFPKSRSLDYYERFGSLLMNPNQFIRDLAAKGLAHSFSDESIDILSIIHRLKDLFVNHLPSIKSSKTMSITTAIAGISSKEMRSSMINSIRIDSTAENPNNLSEEMKQSIRMAIMNVLMNIGQHNTLIFTSSVNQDDFIMELFDFILSNGVIDRSEAVRKCSLTAGRQLLSTYGGLFTTLLLHRFQTILSYESITNQQDKDLLDAFDNRYEAVVIFLGSIGKHLSKDDPNVSSIIDTLIKSLKTPSESVQIAVADELVHMIAFLKGSERIEPLIEDFLKKIFDGESYGDRKGFAIGFSACIKGLGITLLKTYDVMNRLKETCMNGTPINRQGCLFAFESLSERLGLLFEPYIPMIMPVLLKCFSHGSDHVRDAAQSTAKTIMSKLSAHGMKQVLTPLLASLPTEQAWKSRQEAIRLLGTMAFCNPKQLASCLPQIIPRLVEAGSDPHPKVKESAKTALTDISSVIKNPEILRLSPCLLAALSDPANKTKDALEALLECEFMHAIDVASLALLCPILGRALKDRSGDIKRKSSAITGNILTMIAETKILSSYLPQLLPGLKDCLTDPIPDVRATSSKALGKIVTGMSEEELLPIVAWLLQTMRSEVSPVERSGAAQGLAECCITFNKAYTESILRQVLEYRSSMNIGPREGLLWFFSFLPTSLQDNFAQYITICLPVILSGLSDDDDGVREVALRAGQVIVTTLGGSHAITIIPSLLNGIFDDDWRIRQSSVTLLGDLVAILNDTGPTGLDSDDDDDADFMDYNSNTTTYKTLSTLRQVLGVEITNHMLSCLFIIRSDTAITVRQVSLTVWKSIVSNSGKTVVEILPFLVQQMIEKISGTSMDLQLIASRSLGEVVRKQGDRILPVIIPYLKQGLLSSDKSINYKQGIVLGLTEILAATSKKQIDDFIDILIPLLLQAVCNVEIPEIRLQGNKAFVMLYKTMGLKCIEDILPVLLQRIQIVSYPTQQMPILDMDFDQDTRAALIGLKEIVSCRPRDLLEYLIPRLCVYPMTIVHAIALEVTAMAAGSALHYHFSELIPNIVHDLYGCEESIRNLQEKFNAMTNEDDSKSLEMRSQCQLSLEQEGQRFAAIKNAAAAIMQNVSTAGVHHLIADIGKQIEHESNLRRRRWGCYLIEMFFKKSKADFTEYLPVFLKFLLSRVADQDVALLQAVTDSMLSLTTSNTNNAAATSSLLDILTQHIEFIGNCVASTASDARHRAGGVQAILGTISSSEKNSVYILPILTVPKGIEPFLTIYIHGVMNGSVTVREQAAEAIHTLITMCEANVLKPYLIKTTGPLIRVIGERYPGAVKAAILQALNILLEKGGTSLKAFAPQLQTSFVKMLNDPMKACRSRAVLGLEKLMPLTTRVDPLLQELSSLYLSIDPNANSLKISMIEAMSSVLLFGGNKATSNSLQKLSPLVIDMLFHEDENIRSVASLFVLGLGPYVDMQSLNELITELMEVPVQGEDYTHTCGRLIGLSSLLISAGNTKLGEKKEDIFTYILSPAFTDERGNGIVQLTACKCVALLLTPPKHYSIESSAAATSASVNKSESRGIAQAAIHKFAKQLIHAAKDPSSSDLRRLALTAMKQGAKHYPVATAQHLQEFMGSVIACLHDLNLSVKATAERVMKHLLAGSISAKDSTSESTGASGMDAVLKAYSAKADSDSVVFVRDYAKRVVSRLTEDSDDEEKISKW